MRSITIAAALTILAALPAHAQRIHDFGFTAGVSLHPRAASPELAAMATLDARNRRLEVAVASSSDAAYFSVTHVWMFSSLSYGAGLAVYTAEQQTRPGLSASAAFALPIAPRGAAAVQLGARAITTMKTTYVSVGAGIRLAPRRGGLIAGENVEQPQTRAEAVRSWEVVVAQVMLLDNGATALASADVTPTGLRLTFAPAVRGDLMDDVARIARILAASTEALRLEVSAPEPVWISAAATAGGFPPERISTSASEGPVTILVLRPPSASTNRSEQP